MKDDYKYYAIPSPKKHNCSVDHGNRSMVVEREPYKSNSKYLNFDYYLPRDYKVFDCNMTISPLYREEEKTCQDCIKTLPKLCNKCQEKHSQSPSSKIFVNYNKDKAVNHESPRAKYDFKYIGDEILKRAEKLTQPRQDHSPIIKFTDTELKKQFKQLEDEVRETDMKRDKKRTQSTKKKDIYQDPKFYKQSFIFILRQYLKDMWKREGINMSMLPEMR